MYIVVFASCPREAEDRVNASRHRFDKLRDAREYAAPFYNAYILRPCSGWDNLYAFIKTRAEIKRKRYHKARRD